MCKISYGYIHYYISLQIINNQIQIHHMYPLAWSFSSSSSPQELVKGIGAPLRKFWPESPVPEGGTAADPNL